jgi:anthranilate/para-aminobenzoate synthase component I
MIVDLVRADLGRCAVAGSVRACSTPRVVSLPTVHHMVTDVECQLRPDWSLRSLIEAVFPGGSVTGAPKRRTMEIIETLEHGRREIYCGALVVLHPGGVDMSIPIRTGLLDKDGLWLRSGGGIVADSDPEGERLETITKTLAFDPRSSPAPKLAENDV